MARNFLQLGNCVSLPGDSERATELYEQSMDLFREQATSTASLLPEQSGNDGVLPGRSRAGCTAQEAVRCSGSWVTEVAVGLCNLGWIALLQDDIGRAAYLQRKPLPLMGRRMNQKCRSPWRDLPAWLEQRETERAARLWGAAQALHETKAFQETPTSSPRLTLAFPLCAQGWERKRRGVAQGPGDDAR